MSRAIEYFEEVTLSLSDIRKVQDTQHDIYSYGFINRDQSGLINAINGTGASSSLLGLIFAANTAVGIASGVFSIICGMASASLVSLESIVQGGYWHLGDLISFMNANPKYDLIKVKLPMLDYVDDGARFVEDSGGPSFTANITAVHVAGSGWQLKR